MVNDTVRTRSIGFDATDRGNLVVTVGVLVNRTQEAMLLDTLYRELSEYGYLPFRTKSRDLELPPEKIRDILLQCRGTVGICIHRADVTLPYAEAVHSAMLLRELNITTNDTISIVDGDDSRAALLSHTASGMGVIPPAVVHCTQSELYYPHLLLADLVAGTVADQAESKPDATNGVSPEGSVVVVKDTTENSRKGRWGRGYAAAARGDGDVPQSTFEQRYADSPRERISCWFQGFFGHRNSRPPTSDGVTPVVGRLKAIDCEDVATWIDEQ